MSMNGPSVIDLLVMAKRYMYIKTRTRNLPKENSLRKHHLQSFSEWFPLQSLWLFIASLVKFLPQHLLKSYKKKITNHLNTTPFDAKRGGGGGGAVCCVAPRTPPTQGKKNSSSIIPCISGKTPAAHTLHIGAFMTKNVKIPRPIG